MKKISKLYSSPDSCDIFKTFPKELTVFPGLQNDYPVLIIEDFLSADICDRISDNLLNPEIKKAEYKTLEISHENRQATTYNLIKNDSVIYYKAFKKVEAKIESFFNVTLLGEPEGHKGIVYPPGGKYDFHSDACAQTYDEKGNCIEFEVNQYKRILSTIVILSDHVEQITGKYQFTGGEIGFDYLLDSDNKPLSFKGKKGLFIAFPSNPYFSHAVHPVIEGCRVSIVNWYFAVNNRKR